MPPLRARPEDLPGLVGHFVAGLNARYGLAVRGATGAALRLLTRHPWRGNVRELEAVLEQAMILRSEDWITGGDLDLSEPVRSGVVENAASPTAALSWLQQEAVHIAAERRELRRREFSTRFHISREAARRELAGLVLLGLLRLVGGGRGARYVPLSFWLPWVSHWSEWAMSLT